MTELRATKNKWGNSRGYVVGDGGALEICEGPMIDGQPVYYTGEPIPMDGEVVELKGWPDTHAVRVTDRLMIAVEV